MWWWRKVRRADIPNDLRNKFEQFGETVVAMSLRTGVTRDSSGPIGNAVNPPALGYRRGSHRCLANIVCVRRPKRFAL